MFVVEANEWIRHWYVPGGSSWKISPANTLGHFFWLLHQSIFLAYFLSPFSESNFQAQFPSPFRGEFRGKFKPPDLRNS